MLVLFEAYTDEEEATMDWIVPGLLPLPGWGMLTAAPKTGKTFLALQLAREVAAGGQFLGEPCTARRVLYLQRDMQAGSWKYRLKSMRELGVEFPDTLLMWHPKYWPSTLDILTQPGMIWLKNVVTKADPALVIMDTLRNFHSGNENHSDVVARLCDGLADATHGRSLVVVHHDNKFSQGPEAGEYNPIHAARGSSALPGFMDVVIGLSKKRIHIVSRINEERTLDVKRTREGLWDLDGDSRRESVLRLCEEHPDKGHEDIATIAVTQQLMSRATFFRHLQGLQCVHRVSAG